MPRWSATFLDDSEACIGKRSLSSTWNSSETQVKLFSSPWEEPKRYQSLRSRPHACYTRDAFTKSGRSRKNRVYDPPFSRKCPRYPKPYTPNPKLARAPASFGDRFRTGTRTNLRPGRVRLLRNPPFKTSQGLAGEAPHLTHKLKGGLQGSWGLLQPPGLLELSRRVLLVLLTSLPQSQTRTANNFGNPPLPDVLTTPLTTQVGGALHTLLSNLQLASLIISS